MQRSAAAQDSLDFGASEFGQGYAEGRRRLPFQVNTRDLISGALTIRNHNPWWVGGGRIQSVVVYLTCGGRIGTIATGRSFRAACRIRQNSGSAQRSRFAAIELWRVGRVGLRAGRNRVRLRRGREGKAAGFFTMVRNSSRERAWSYGDRRELFTRSPCIAVKW